MRSFDEPEKFKPFGEKVEKPKPEVPEWHQKPGAPKGVLEDKNGRMKTDIPLPKLHFWGKL